VFVYRLLIDSYGGPSPSRTCATLDHVTNNLCHVETASGCGQYGQTDGARTVRVQCSRDKSYPGAGKRGGSYYHYLYL